MHTIIVHASLHQH